MSSKTSSKKTPGNSRARTPCSCPPTKPEIRTKWKERHCKLLVENVTKHYYVAGKSAYENVNLAAREIANSLDSDLAKRMETMSKLDECLVVQGKQQRSTFKDLSLQIHCTIEANIRITNCLDFMLKPNTGKYKLFCQPNGMPRYVFRFSKHSPGCWKDYPQESTGGWRTSQAAKKLPWRPKTRRMRRWRRMASSKPQYSWASKRTSKDVNGESCDANCESATFTWVTPPFHHNVATDIGRRFLHLVDHPFPKGRDLHKICNRSW